ncbi:MAG: fructosamine kinase family protein [Clostridia bacterium]|nr:fructosamine kinase family protein [Clostridia bacterium]MBQ8926387.1 fructosamine kinase family protein [Clostridia bacterium]
MATVPVFASLGDALNALAPGASLEARRPVGGSDLNRVYRLTLSDGSEFFAKTNASSLLPMYEAEAEGLAAMRTTGTIGVTDVLAIGLDPAEFGQDAAFLLLRWMDSGAKRADFWETFAEELAAMHAADTSFVFAGKDGAVTVSGTPRYGFSIDNYIGSTPQINTAKSTWVDFFRECRLHPQVRWAYDAGYLDRSAMRQADSVMERLESLLPEPDHPSLLHGDLWGGNFMTGPDGKAWLIDPATYVGHREADLAMTELFGGFAPAFYSAYRQIANVDPEYDDRRDLYNLYHLLNHVNLFGYSYVGSVLRTLDRFGG